MNKKRLVWEIRFALGQIPLSLRHTAHFLASVLTLNMKDLDERLGADLDAYVERMMAQRP